MVIHWAGCLLEELDVLKEYKKVNISVNLGSIPKASGRSLTEIQRRITVEKSSMARLRNVTCNLKITKEKSERLIKTLVFPVFLVCGSNMDIEDR